MILATGYSFGFPIVEDGRLIEVKENRANLYKYMYPPELSDRARLIPFSSNENGFEFAEFSGSDWSNTANWVNLASF